MPSFQFDKKMKSDYKGESVFPLMFIIIGITLLLCGIILLGTFDSRANVGIIVLFLGILVVFTRKGTIVDFKNQRIKHYIAILFLKFGKWKTLHEYSYVLLLRLNQKSYGYSHTGVQFTERKKVYRICLLNKNHRKRLNITDFKDKNKALSEAQGIAQNLKFEFVDYNPK